MPPAPAGPRLPDAPVRRASGPRHSPGGDPGKFEQSNYGRLFDHRLILKIFRTGRARDQSGLRDRPIPRRKDAVRPRAEDGRRPRIYDQRRSEPISLAILQGLVPNQGNGWEHALHELKCLLREGAFPRQVVGSLEVARAIATWSWREPRNPGEAREGPIGPYSAGRRTARPEDRRTPSVLASDPTDPAFAPDHLTRETCELRSPRLTAGSTRRWRHLRSMSTSCPRIRARRSGGSSKDRPGSENASSPSQICAPNAVKTGSTAIIISGRCLRSDGDFVILDFEGEPARRVEERPRSVSPLKDVVGMLRSFDYAAFAALFEIRRDVPDQFERLEPWAKLWQIWTSAVFWRVYGAGGPRPSLPATRPHSPCCSTLTCSTRSFMSLTYELNNRPNWVCIPLQGIESLIEREEAADGDAMPSIGWPMRLDRGRSPNAAQRFRPASPRRRDSLPLLREARAHASSSSTGHSGPTSSSGLRTLARSRSSATSTNGMPMPIPCSDEASAASGNGSSRGSDRVESIGMPSRRAVAAPRVEKADPYGFFAETRPRTASKVWDFSGYDWNDRDWMAAPTRVTTIDKPIAIYEVHLGSWMRVPEENGRWLTYQEMAAEACRLCP